MTRRTWPIWLLRDWPALVGLMLSFWPLMILAIASGRKAMAGKSISQSVLDLLMALLPRAEARLRFTLAREAARRLGLNPRDVQLEDLPSPDSWDAFVPRFNAYAHAIMDMDKAAVTFTAALRRCFDMQAGAMASASHIARNPLEPLILSSAHRARPSTCRAEAQRRRKDARVLMHARGPPQLLQSEVHTPEAPASGNAPACPP